MTTNNILIAEILLIGFLIGVAGASSDNNNYSSQYPPAFTQVYINATTTFSDTIFPPQNTINQSKSLTGAWDYNQWVSTSNISQRFHVNLGEPKLITRVYYENLHNSGGFTDSGAKNFTFWGSNSQDSFNNLTYTNDTGWVEIPASVLSFDQHIAADSPDPKNFTLTNVVAYQYYAIKIKNSWGSSSVGVTGLRRVELQSRMIYYAIGDSITAGYNVTTPYWKLMRDNHDPNAMADFNSTGSTSYWSISNFSRHSIGQNVFIMANLNDRVFNSSYTGLETANNLYTLYNLSQTNGSYPYILLEGARSTDAGTFADQKDNNTIIESRLTALGIPFMKVYDAYDSIPGNGIFDTVNTSLCPDGIHPNDEGQYLISEYVWENMRTNNGYYNNEVPPEYNNTYIKSTSTFPHQFFNTSFTFNISKPVSGAWNNNQWVADVSVNSSQRLHIDLGSAKTISRIYYENTHNSGSFTDWGAKNFTLWGSNSVDSFNNLTYTNDTGWTQIPSVVLSFDQHALQDYADTKYIPFTNSNAYRYYAFKIENNYGGSSVGIRQIGLQSASIMLYSNFTISNSSGIEPLLTHFTDTSTTNGATIDAWYWDFGDGTTSTDQNPPDHTYQNGTYDVNLTITNTSLSLVSTKIQTVTVYKLPNADFSSFDTQGTAPFTTYLYDTSTNLNSGPYTYYWDLGDGNTSTDQNLYYTWNLTGTFDVKHSVTDSFTTKWKNTTGYVTVGTPVVAPVASFYGGPQLGAPPLQVFFTDVSTNTPTSWLWEFGDGTTNVSQNPIKWYNQSGFFTVNLTATNSAGSNITSQQNFVMVY